MFWRSASHLNRPHLMVGSIDVICPATSSSSYLHLRIPLVRGGHTDGVFGEVTCGGLVAGVGCVVDISSRS
jgi:hypothetical protein